MKRADGLASGSPIDLAAMRDAQDQHAQDIVLDARHDAPASDAVSPQRRRSSAGGAPERDPEAARVVRHGEALAKVAHDALRDLDGRARASP